MPEYPLLCVKSLILKLYSRIKKDEVVVIPIHAVNCVKDIWGEDAHEFKLVAINS